MRRWTMMAAALGLGLLASGPAAAFTDGDVARASCEVITGTRSGPAYVACVAALGGIRNGDDHVADDGPGRTSRVRWCQDLKARGLLQAYGYRNQGQCVSR